MVAPAHSQYARFFSCSGCLRTGTGRWTKQACSPGSGSGWHKSGDLIVPEGLHLLFLPSHSPELQPAERLWPLSNEPLANRVFNSLDELQDVQAERCRWLQAHPDIIRGRTFFHWWPSLEDTTEMDLI